MMIYVKTSSPIIEQRGPFMMVKHGFSSEAVVILLLILLYYDDPATSFSLSL